MLVKSNRYTRRYKRGTRYYSRYYGQKRYRKLRMYRTMKYKHKMFSYKMFKHTFYVGYYVMGPGADASAVNLEINPVFFMNDKWEQYRAIWQYFCISNITYTFYPLQAYQFGTSPTPACRMMIRKPDGYRDWLNVQGQVGVTWDSFLLDPDSKQRILDIYVNRKFRVNEKLPHDNLEENTLYDMSGTTVTNTQTLMVNTPAKRKFKWKSTDDVTLAPKPYQVGLLNTLIVYSGQQVPTQGTQRVMDVYATITICYKGTRIGSAPEPPGLKAAPPTFQQGFVYAQSTAISPLVQLHASSNAGVDGTQETELEY